VSKFFNQPSEEAFIGCVIASEGNVMSDFPVTAEHFFTVGARAVFTAAAELHAAGSPISAFTVSQRITDEQAIAIGGDHRVSEICFFHASIREAAHHFAAIEGCLSLRRARDIGAWIQNQAGQADDPNEFCAELQRRVATLESQGDSDDVLQPCLKAIGDKLDRMEAGVTENGLQTRLAAWNKAFGGILEGQMYGIAARPGLGKTALMEMFIADFIAAGHPVTVFEKDMSPQKLIERIACRAARVPYWTLAKGFLKKESYGQLRSVLDLLREMPLHLYNPANLTVERMCAIARRDIRTKGTKAVFLDHLQALRVGKDLRTGLTMASLAIRANVTDTGVPHIVLAHINRDGAKDGRPKPEHIKEVDQFFGDADGLAILWSKVEGADVPTGEFRPVNLYVAKNRDGGESEEEILFNGQLMNFVDAVTPNKTAR
jgi:replicative DNA helicase